MDAAFIIVLQYSFLGESDATLINKVILFTSLFVVRANVYH